MKINSSIWKGHVRGPRWMGFEGELKKICFQYELDCETVRTTSFLWERVDFKVTGDSFLVDLVKAQVEKALKEYTS